MQTNDMIKKLSADLTPPVPHFYRSLLLWWLGGTAALLAFFFFFIPLRPDLWSRFQSLPFQAETLLLITLFGTATWIAYRSVIPGLMGRAEQLMGIIVTGLLGVLLISKLSLASFATEFRDEMSFYRGMCGPILLSLAVAETVLGVILARRAAPTNLVRTGAWIGVSAGALGLLATKLICDHENFFHLLIWHAVPAGALVGTSAVAARRWLHW